MNGANAAEVFDEIRVVGVTPSSSLGIEARKLSFGVQSVDSKDLAKSLALDVSDYLNANLAGVNINSAQNNPLQPDVQYRGFTLSPLLGLSQGLAIYQDGARINEPLGDSVNWDLLPESAIDSIDLISGASPLFGLNTLGGALSVKMKNGFSFTDTQMEGYTGSWGRQVGTVESGNNNGRWGYYVNATQFEEDGWRDLSSSDAQNLYGSLSWRGSNDATVDVTFQSGTSELIGNGALPVGLINIERSAIFTAPDITENDMQMWGLNGSYDLNDRVRFSGNAFLRNNKTHSFNGDGSEFETCEYAGGAKSLFEEADDTEDALEDLLGIVLDDICDGQDASITAFADLKQLIEQRANQFGLDPEDFELEDIIDDISGTGIIADEAINNISSRRQRSEGLTGQLEFVDTLLPLPNQLVVGVSYYAGASNFKSVLELAELDPLTRSTWGLGTGAFFDEAATNIYTNTRTSSIYFTDTMDLNDALSLTVSGRFNRTGITLRDRSGERPELNGDHTFSRLNPAVGFAYEVNEAVNVYGSYSESNRVPTPIELACNEGVFELAQQFAVADGEDPDDIEFECRLPNAFLADPPLEDVVTKSVEIGIRGEWSGHTYNASVFNSANRDDILFQTTGRSTGLFANVDKTRRLGIETSIGKDYQRLSWQGSYSYLQATFEDNLDVLSPNHPNANADGELQVHAGDRLPGLPEHIVKLSADFQLTQSLSMGSELIYNSSQIMRGDESNDIAEIGGYTVMNLRVSFSASDTFLLFVRVTNVFDTEYENFGLLGESPDEILPNLTDSRPLFLGVGAPRGAWVGMRYQF